VCELFTFTVPTWLSRRLAERRQILRIQCNKKPPNPNFIEKADFRNLIVVEELKLVFCYIEKISCTTWKKVLYQAKNNGTAFDGKPHARELFSWLSDYSPAKRKRILDTYYKAMFVREPFARLLSGFKDRVQPRGNGYFRKYFHSITDKELEKNSGFPLFVKFVLSYNHSSMPSMNPHWRSYEALCPCEVDYDFIGHFENLCQEASHLLKVIGVDHYVTFPEYHPSKSKPYLLEYYSKLTREQIFKLQKCYELDFKLFAYDFPGPLQAILDVKDASDEERRERT